MRFPPLGMTKQHHAGTAGCQHGCRYITSMRTRRSLMAVLPAKQDTAAVKAHRHLHQIGRRREQHPGDPVECGTGIGGGKRTSLGKRRVHLPVRGNYQSSALSVGNRTGNAAGLSGRLAPAPQACHLPAGKKHPRSGEIGNCPAMVECLQIPPRFHPRAMALFGPAGTKSHLRDEPCSRHYETASNRQS